MDNKSCENCLYFSKFYFFNGKRFIYAKCGKCLNTGIFHSAVKHSNNFVPCEMWTPSEALTEDNREQIVKKIKTVTQDLIEILDVLQSDVLKDR